jgi:sensor c-di-GMP phosphodiesterase-like protein
MIINLLDIAPFSDAEIRAMQQRIEEEANKAQKQSEKMTKQSEKAAKKAEKAAKKMAKKLEKQAKKLEKKAKKLEKQFSAAPTKTITTVQECTENNCEMQYASMPVGLILSVCASLLICLASAWYYRRCSVKKS